MLRKFGIQNLTLFGVVFLAIVPFAIVACGVGDGPAAEGSWKGFSRGISLDVTLTDQDGTMNGNGTLTVVDESVAIDAKGTYNSPVVSLTLTSEIYESMNFQGTVSDDNMSISGSLSGSGFEGFQITLNKVR